MTLVEGYTKLVEVIQTWNVRRGRSRDASRNGGQRLWRDADDAHANFCRRHKLVGWIVTQGSTDYSGKFVARLITTTHSRYVLVSDTVTGLQAQLPNRLVRTERQPAEPPEVIEIWFSR